MTILIKTETIVGAHKRCIDQTYMCRAHLFPSSLQLLRQWTAKLNKWSVSGVGETWPDRDWRSIYVPNREVKGEVKSEEKMRVKIYAVFTL